MPQGLWSRVAVDPRPLRTAAFRRLWWGQGVSFIGFQLSSTAVAAQIFAITSSSFWVGMLGPVTLVPLVIFGLWGGAVADAVDRRRLLLAGSVIAWAASIALLAQSALRVDNVWLMLATMAVHSTGFAITSPVRGAIIPRLVPVEEVPAANTLNFLVSSMGAVIGPLVAGVVLAHGGYTGAYLIDVVLFGAGFYAALRLPPLPPLGQAAPAVRDAKDATGAKDATDAQDATGAKDATDTTGATGATGVPDAPRPGLRAVVEGLRFIAGHPVVLMSFVVDIIAMAFALPRALFPEIVAERFGGSPVAFGWLTASIALGSAVGGLFSGWVGRVRRQGVALTVVIALWGLSVAAAGLAGSLWLMVALLALGGAADLVSAVWRQTILQTYAPDEMRGRLQGVFYVVVAGGPRLGDLRAGATAAVVGVVPAWVGGGLACAAFVLVAGFAVPAFRAYRPRHHP
ncbi:MFS family permease [Thermocatellispora tengchongensis]|uniref:MFS family permease n=1 Tax=Thermocatellispora tengchongensis TaxID=1073253 RepID=A0A840PLN9_9ACTN|nr:MFS transporter [Thermocatellispora tengchongensis]MBB5138711.1 MFS family permease [Thermocatellispora tengchongensis]